MSKRRITIILGTRPEIIRLSQIIKLFDTWCELRLVHTGQNSQPYLAEGFFHELGIRMPDKYVQAPTNSLGAFLSTTFLSLEQEFEQFPPDAVLVLGDTNSSLVALLAKRKRIPVYHLEAGNRSFDPNVPEEVNRKIIDHFADFNLAYTENARTNLLREGLHPRNIAVVGSPLYEVISFNHESIQNSTIMEELGVKPKGYFLVSAHRQENIDNEKRFNTLKNTLIKLVEIYGIRVILTAHPRLVSMMQKFLVDFKPHIEMREPFSFFDYCKLQMNARAVLSDSGSVAEEASIMNFPAVVLRDSIERPESLECGRVILAGLETIDVLESIEILDGGNSFCAYPMDYFIPDTSNRVFRFVISTIGRYEFWSGIRK